MQTTSNISFGGQKLWLTSDRTLWWPAGATLFVTDLHAGKTEHMRRYGLPIPGGSLEKDLAGLDTAVGRHHAEKLVFLGDLFHSEKNNEWNIFASWAKSRPYQIVLIRGNHDRFLADEQLLEAGLTVYEEPYQYGPFTLRHHPSTEPRESEYILAGHVHPAYVTSGFGKDTLRSPCFWLQKNQLILPAYGSFTGGYTINKELQAGDSVYICANDGSAIITHHKQ